MSDDELTAACAELLRLDEGDGDATGERAVELADLVASATAEGLPGLAAQAALLRSLLSDGDGDPTLPARLVRSLASRLEQLAGGVRAGRRALAEARTRAARPRPPPE